MDEEDALRFGGVVLHLADDTRLRAWAQRTCRSRGGRVVLRGPNKRCLTVLARTGLADLFAVAEGHAVPARAGGTLATRTP